MDIKEVELLQLLPLFVRRDETAQAMAEVLQPTLWNLGVQTGNALIFPRLDELGSDIVDELAWERHVDFYDHSLPLDTRRELVRRANEFHWYKGTKYAVQTMVDTLMAGGTVREWFEFGGEPYTFTLDFAGGLKDPKVYEFMLYAVSKVKNKRSWLAGVSFTAKHDGSLAIGAVTGTARSRAYHAAPYIVTVRRVAALQTGSATRTYRYRKYTPAYTETAGNGGTIS